MLWCLWMLVGEHWLGVVFNSTYRLRGASYKIIKGLVARRCGGDILGGVRRFVAVSPLQDEDGAFVMPVLGGWVRSVDVVPVLGLRGGYRFRVSWVGEEAGNAVYRLVSCLEGGRDPEVFLESMTVMEARPLSGYTWRLSLLTPAQLKFRALGGRSAVLAYPTVSRLLRHGLSLLGAAREDYMAVDYYTGVTGGEWRKVTVVLDEEKRSNWAVSGWLWITLGHEAPDRVVSLVSRAMALVGYLGVGKSRLEGLGQARIEADSGS